MLRKIDKKTTLSWQAIVFARHPAMHREPGYRFLRAHSTRLGVRSQCALGFSQMVCSFCTSNARGGIFFPHVGLGTDALRGGLCFGSFSLLPYVGYRITLYQRMITRYGSISMRSEFVSLPLLFLRLPGYCKVTLWSDVHSVALGYRLFSSMCFPGTFCAKFHTSLYAQFSVY